MFTRLISVLYVSSALFFIPVSYSQSDVPRIISYQGQITNASGTLNGKHTVAVSLYSDELGTNRLWTTQKEVDINSGVFQLLLGVDNPLPDNSVLSGPIYVGIGLNGTPEMRPLTLLTASPYALNIPDKSITKQKLSLDYLGGIAIDGQRINKQGAVLNLQSGPGISLFYDPEELAVTFSLTNVFGNQTPQWIGNQPCSTNLNDDGADNRNTIAGGCGNTTRVGSTIPIYASILEDFRIEQLQTILLLVVAIQTWLPDITPL